MNFMSLTVLTPMGCSNDFVKFFTLTCVLVTLFQIPHSNNSLNIEDNVNAQLCGKHFVGLYILCGVNLVVGKLLRWKNEGKTDK